MKLSVKSDYVINGKPCSRAGSYHEAPVERVKEVFDYDPWTGMLCRRGAGPVGSKVGRGYLRAYLDGKPFKVHRLAYVIMTGRWPVGVLDHKNGTRSDNRWDNLEEVTQTVNLLRAHHRGVSQYGKHGKWQARLHRKHLGVFDTEEEAIAAYQQAKEIALAEAVAQMHEIQNCPVH